MDIKDTIFILQHNVRNWETNKYTFTNIYRDINPDIIVFNSHGLKANKNIKMHSYITYQINTSEEYSDGSAILIKHNLKHRIHEKYDTDMLQVTIETDTGPINIATTYLPPRRAFLPITDFHKIASQTNPTYIIGDLNAHHPTIDKKRSNTVGKMLAMMLDNNKLKHIGPDFPTFLSHNASTTPDIILSNNKTYHNIQIQPGPITPSDHIPILIKITSHPIKIDTPPTYITNKTNWESFISKVLNLTKNINTDTKMNQQNLDNSLKEWINAITKTMEECIPTKTYKTTQKPIYNEKIKVLQFWVRHLLNNSIRNGWTYPTYITYKTIKQTIINECKKQNNKNWECKIKHLNTIYKDPKKFWQNLKQLIGNPTHQKPFILHDNKKVYDDKGKEQIFREIWSNVFKISPIENLQFDQDNERIINNYINNNKLEISPYHQANPDNLNTDNYFTSEITTQDIKNIIKQLNNNTPGHTKINKFIMQKLPDDVLDIYTKLLNISLSMGYFPTIFKHAKIKLLPKPNKLSTDPNNYRPISLLEVPGKIFEKIINLRVRTHLEINNTLPTSQHGFRKQRSTETALATITETLATALADKKQCCIVLRDVAKAFDKVWIKGLKYKIQNINLPPILSKLLNSFLDNRTASITLNNHEGPPFPLYSGVPQGSSLSPTLYTIYTHDIPPPITDGINIQYADDITQIITQAGKSRNMLTRKIEKEISHINKYEHKWKIKTNTTKFTILPIALKKTTPVNIEGNIIPYSKNANILGLKLGIHGFSKHVADISKKATLALNTIRRFEKLNTNIKLHLVKACIIPILTYPTYTLNALSKTHLLSLQRIQNKAIRFAFNDYYPYTTTTKELHLRSNIEPITITLHNRGNKIKQKIENSLQDPLYLLATREYQHDRDHGWFKKQHKVLNEINIQPVYT